MPRKHNLIMGVVFALIFAIGVVWAVRDPLEQDESDAGAEKPACFVERWKMPLRVTPNSECRSFHTVAVVESPDACVVTYYGIIMPGALRHLPPVMPSLAIERAPCDVVIHRFAPSFRVGYRLSTPLRFGEPLGFDIQADVEPKNEFAGWKYLDMGPFWSTVQRLRTERLQESSVN